MIKNYLEIDENGVAVAGTFSGHPGITIESNWVEIIGDARIGCTWDGTTWSDPVDPRTYLEKRVAAYAELNQFEMQFDDQLNGTNTWFDAVAAIKVMYPAE